MLKAELHDVRRRLRQLQKNAAKRSKQAAVRARQDACGRRCEPSSPSCMVVLVCSGGSLEASAEFVLGQGWRKRKAATIQCAEKKRVQVDVASAYDTAPLSQIAALGRDPVEAGVIPEAHMLTIVMWLVERSLRTWVECQNRTHGVAPSRAQLVEYAFSVIPPSAPAVWQQKARSRMLGSERKQRKWLANFRVRWGLRLGKLQLRSHLSMEEKRAKAGFCGNWGKPGFGSVWQALKWERVPNVKFLL